MSLTFTLSGQTSELVNDFFPPVELSGAWAVGLLNFSSYHNIPNIDETNNCIIIGNQTVKIPTGCYELEDIQYYINHSINPKNIVIKTNLNTLKVTVNCSDVVRFPKQSSLGLVLGFENEITLPKLIDHESQNPINIFRVNIIRVECNIARGSYLNGERSHSIYEFFPDVEPGFKIIKVPNPVIYHDLSVNTIDRLVVRILDQDNREVNFRKETITIQIHLKKQ